MPHVRISVRGPIMVCFHCSRWPFRFPYGRKRLWAPPALRPAYADARRGAPSASLNPDMATDYFRMRAKITTRISTTRRKALSTSRIGSISCSLVCFAGTAGAANAGGVNLGAAT